PQRRHFIWAVRQEIKHFVSAELPLPDNAVDKVADIVSLIRFTRGLFLGNRLYALPKAPIDPHCKDEREPNRHSDAASEKCKNGNCDATCRLPPGDYNYCDQAPDCIRSHVAKEAFEFLGH